MLGYTAVIQADIGGEWVLDVLIVVVRGERREVRGERGKDVPASV